MATATQTYTPDDLLAMPKNGRRYELVDGELVEKEMGFESGRIGLRIGRRLDEYAESSGLGRAAPSDAGYQCFPDDPGQVRLPDASFISHERLPASTPDPRGWCRVAPEVVAEVVSPHDIAEDVDAKIQQWFAAGVRMLWLALTARRVVQVHRPDRPTIEVGKDGVLDGDDVLPGFRCPVASLFPSPR